MSLRSMAGRRTYTQRKILPFETELSERLRESIEYVKETQAMTTEPQQLGTISGKVSQVSRKDGDVTGVKLEGREETWLNFSRPEYRGHFEIPERGDNVKLGTTRGKDDRLWVKTCEIQHKGNSAQTTYDEGQVPTGGRDLSIMRQTSLKAAAEIVTAWIGRLSAETVFDRKTISRNVLDLAEDFERWVIREDVKFE